jgi:hypothetical protein
MTILQKPQQSRDGHAGKRWYKFGHVDDVVRHTDAGPRDLCGRTSAMGTKRSWVRPDL